MRYLLLAALGTALVAAAQAQVQPQAVGCKAAAAEKKLAGAALSSFLKKCQSDARSACGTAANEKKLSGAAKSSFTAKCLRDKTGG